MNISIKEEELQKIILTAAHNNFAKGLNVHAFFKLNNHFTGEDLVQETFAKTWSYIVKGGEIVLMKAFLYHVLNNLIIDEYRKRKNLSLDNLIENGYDPTNTDIEKKDNLLDGKYAMELIEKLPTNYREIMKMKYIEEMSLEEISAVTKISKKTLAVKLHRGLFKLKNLFENL